MKLQHMYRRNLRQAVCRLPAEMLVRCLSFLSAKDQFSIIRVCRHFRAHAIDNPSLWTWVDQIHHLSALSFVLERSKNSAVDITNLRVGDQDDIRLLLLAHHMRRVRILNIYVDNSFGPHSAFTKPAPLLERLSFHNVESTSMSLELRLNANNYPRLYCIQFNKIQLSGTIFSNFQAMQTLCTFSFGDVGSPNTSMLAQVSNLLHNITTINIELASWGASLDDATLTPAIRRINIRWTKPGLFIPSQAMPSPSAWSLARIVHITHVGDSLADPSQADLAGGNFPMLAQARPRRIGRSTVLVRGSPRIQASDFYRYLLIRTSATSGRSVHVRVVHEDGRQRAFCGLHPTTIFGVAARIPGLELHSLTVATTAVALNVLSNSTWPALRLIHLVADTRDTAWVSIFAQEMFNVPKLTHLELSIERDVEDSWSTATIIRVLGCCIAAGHNLQQVSFLGFAPDRHCTTRAEAFTKKVVVDRNWNELQSERVWFTKPAFEW